MNNETLSAQELQFITNLQENFWRVTQRGLSLNLPETSPSWEIYPEYNEELKNLFAILPRHIFAGNLGNFQFKSTSLDGKLTARWNTGFNLWNSSLPRELIKIHFLIERHCILPIMESSKENVKETMILGSDEQIAESIGLPKVYDRIYDALRLFALGFYQLRLELGKENSLNSFSLYDFSSYDRSLNMDKIPDFIQGDNCYYLNIKSAYLNILNQLPLKASEYSAIKSYPVESQRWLELITHWRKQKIQQGTNENELVMDYKTLCRWMPMSELISKEYITRQIEQLHQPFFTNGLLVDFTLTPQNQKLTNWILKYQFAPR